MNRTKQLKDYPDVNLVVEIMKADEVEYNDTNHAAASMIYVTTRMTMATLPEILKEKQGDDAAYMLKRGIFMAQEEIAEALEVILDFMTRSADHMIRKQGKTPPPFDDLKKQIQATADIAIQETMRDRDNQPAE